ncbi:MAG TPA: hypothetical protein DCE44_17725 [Verrucomicrobiales bacterium]|nr:hypothetical protein [Verrucomicrobiales bacterium]
MSSGNHFPAVFLPRGTVVHKTSARDRRLDFGDSLRTRDAQKETPSSRKAENEGVQDILESRPADKPNRTGLILRWAAKRNRPRRNETKFVPPKDDS